MHVPQQTILGQPTKRRGRAKKPTRTRRRIFRQTIQEDETLTKWLDGRPFAATIRALLASAMSGQTAELPVPKNPAKREMSRFEFELINQVTRIGINVNQLARSANTSGLNPTTAAALLLQLAAIDTQIGEFITAARAARAGRKNGEGN